MTGSRRSVARSVVLLSARGDFSENSTIAFFSLSGAQDADTGRKVEENGGRGEFFFSCF